MPVPDALIVGLGIGQAESGLVEKQKRRLLGLKTIGLEGLAAVIGALAVTARLGRKNAALLAAAGQEELPAQQASRRSQGSRRLEGRCASRHSTTERMRNWRRRRRAKSLRMRRKHI
jgi:hypothetical protein